MSIKTAAAQTQLRIVSAWIGTALAQDDAAAARKQWREVADQARAERHPETFAFLGLTYYCGWTRDGRFIVKHKTQSSRLSRKLAALRQEARRRMHTPLGEQHLW